MRRRSLHCTCCPWLTAIFDTDVSAKKPISPVQMQRNKNQPTRKCPNPEDPGIS
ncbi:hypothetical protein ALQ15_110525 [Pseudomonas syringae pv. actinidiae]|uniref:Uncharacterized protein n=1 Tax=Pseudomonas syringae pv. actinidiae TaxID=103796 RepID=A0A7Z6U867_PSESF|nr:hypothetical protein ALQ15_110525 [Pseudomonas syringae pv. actinidiae]